MANTAYYRADANDIPPSTALTGAAYHNAFQAEENVPQDWPKTPFASLSTETDEARDYKRVGARTEGHRRGGNPLFGPTGRLMQAALALVCLATIFPIIVSIIYLVRNSTELASTSARLCTSAPLSGAAASAAGVPKILLQGYMVVEEYDGRWNLTWELGYSAVLSSKSPTPPPANTYVLEKPIVVYESRGCCWAPTPDPEPMFSLIAEEDDAGVAAGGGSVRGWRFLVDTKAAKLRDERLAGMYGVVTTSAVAPDDTVELVFVPC